jgi:hypothetical protein
MPLGQLGDTHSGGNAFDGELDAVQCSSLAFVFLNDFSPDFGESLFDFDHHRIANWPSQGSPALLFL